MSVDFDRMAANLPVDQRKQLSRQYRRGAKNETSAFLACFFLGIFGAHHFYLGEWGKGFAHLIISVLAAGAVLAGVLGNVPALPITVAVIVLLLIGLIWEIIELFQIDNKVRQRNLRLAESLIGAGALSDSSTLTDAVSRLDSAMVGAAVGAAVAGTISAEDVSAAREMAGEHNTAIMEEFDSSTTKYISEDPNATSPGAPMSWTETSLSQPPAMPETDASAEPSAGDTLDMPAPEYVTHTHTETATSVTDSYEFDRSPDATQPMAIPTPVESEAATWPDHPPLEELSEPPVTPPADTGVPLAGLAAGAAALGAGALLADAEHHGSASGVSAEEPMTLAAGPDVTDHHAYVPSTQPIADVEGVGAAPQYVALSEDAPVVAGAAGVAAEDAANAPLAVDASTIGRDATDAHPHAHHVGLVADVEVNPSRPVYVDLPGETYVPPVVPQTPAAQEANAVDAPNAAGLAGLAAAGAIGAGATYAAHHDEQHSASEAPSQAASEALPDARPEAAPTSGPLMKRIRMKRQIVVDGQVVREEIVEKLVPVDTDTKSLVAAMDTELGHATKEEIAHMAHLDPNASLDLRQRFDAPQQGEE